MFAHALVYFYFLFTITILAAAMPGGSPPTTTTATQTITVTQTATSPEPTWACTTGPIQCCESIQKVHTLSSGTRTNIFADGNKLPSSSQPTDHEASVILGLLELVVEGLDVLVGLTCSALTGVANGSCEANVVCCQNNNVVHINSLLSSEACDGSQFLCRAA